MSKVLLLFGGDSEEHYVSCLSAKSIIENIDKKKYDLTCVGIYNSYWYIFNDSTDFLKKGTWLESKNNTKIFNIIDFIKKFDVVFPILHGSNGEDGKLQGMLDLFKLKYVGCKTSASVLGMDKELAKILFKHINIPIVPYVTMTYPDIKLKKILTLLEFPIIVKPANGGSSIGISKARNKKELIEAIKEAKKYDKKIIFEKLIQARELECSVLEKKGLYASSIGEIKVNTGFYDYDSKYINDQAQIIIPANIPKSIEKQIKYYSKKIFKHIGASGLARVDFFYKEDENQVYVNEINTMPGFTTISMFPNLLVHDKMKYKEIISTLIENAK